MKELGKKINRMEKVLNTPFQYWKMEKFTKNVHREIGKMENSMAWEKKKNMICKNHNG